jgi:hypothetical protein
MINCVLEHFSWLAGWLEAGWLAGWLDTWQRPF